MKRATLLAGCLLALACSPTEVHLIPKGYQGDIVILPGYSQGTPPKREGRAIVFEIPPSGILVTQDHPSSGWHLSRFYYVDSSGNRERLEDVPSTIHDSPDNRANRKPMVALRTGTGESRGVDLPCTIYSVTYYVGTRPHLLARTVDAANAQDLRVRDLIKARRLCR